MYVKVHEGERGRIVAVCDKDLIGKVLEEGDLFLDLDKYRGFYVGELAGRERVEELLSDFASVNLVGRRCVDIALAMGIADDDDVIYIKETPHIQIYKV